MARGAGVAAGRFGRRVASLAQRTLALPAILLPTIAPAWLAFAGPTTGSAQDRPAADDPRAAALEELTRTIEERPEDASVQAELARAFRELDTDFPASGAWSSSLAENYCWAVVFLTEPGVPESLLERGRDEARLRAADLALTRPLELASAGRELERGIASELWPAGRAREALPRLEHAILAYAHDPECVAVLSCEQGQALLTLNDLEGAERAAERAEAASASGVPGFDATTLGMIERLRFGVQLSLGLPDHAAVALAKLRELVRGIHDPVLSELLLVEEGNFDLATESWEELIQRCESELGAGADGLSPHGLATLQLQLGQAHHELAYDEPAAHLDRAVAAFERALEIGLPSSASKAGAHLRLADLQRRRGDLSAARRELGRARTMYATAGSGARHLAEERARLATVASRIAYAEPAPPAELEVRLAELESAYHGFLEHWRGLPRHEDGVGFLHYGERRAVLCELVRLLLDLRGPSEGARIGLEHLMRAQALGTFAEQLGGAPPDLAEARATLCGPERGVLIVLPGPERSFTFAFDRERTLAVEIGALRDWRPLRERWTALLSRSPRDEINDRALERRRRELAELGGELARKLLPPGIEDELSSWSGVSIVGLEWIGDLPFDALPFRGEELGLRLATGYLPSLSVGCLLARRARRREPGSGFGGLRMIGAPADPPAAKARWKWDDIAWNDGRARELESLFGESEVRRGDAATLEALGELCDGRALVLEIMAHGFYQPGEVPPAGFALASGLVGASEVRRLSPPPLVALAVCGAAKAPLRTGDDGVAHVGGGFLRAGAQSVLYAFVDIEQEPTERLLDATYRHMVRSGLSPAEALLHARRELASVEATSDPYDHALVQVVGLAFEPIPQARGAGWRRRWVAGSAVAAGLVALAAAWRRRRGKRAA